MEKITNLNRRRTASKGAKSERLIQLIHRTSMFNMGLLNDLTQKLRANYDGMPNEVSLQISKKKTLTAIAIVAVILISGVTFLITRSSGDDKRCSELRLAFDALAITPPPQIEIPEPLRKIGEAEKWSGSIKTFWETADKTGIRGERWEYLKSSWTTWATSTRATTLLEQGCSG